MTVPDPAIGDADVGDPGDARGVLLLGHGGGRSKDTDRYVNLCRRYGESTEVRLGVDDGTPTDCAASFDNLRVVPKSYLVDHVCSLDPIRMVEACRALRTAVDS